MGNSCADTGIGESPLMEHARATLELVVQAGYCGVGTLTNHGSKYAQEGLSWAPLHQSWPNVMHAHLE
eukprot:7056494-Karenia_brevis.AAC.1